MSSRRHKASVRRGLEQRLLQRWRALDLPRPTCIVVGFSGGPDSLALAAALGVLRPLLRADLTLIHVDHGLRSASTRDAERALALAADLGLACHVSRVDPDALAAHRGVGVEEAARRERYRLFLDFVVQRDNAILALAHHRQDQAETVLLHLLRGAGVHGAGGMSELSEIRVPWWGHGGISPHNLRTWRPFLSESADVVHNYTHSLGLQAIDDESNWSVEYRRNAIRHEILPAMERLSPGAAAALARFAALAAEDDRYLTAAAEDLLAASRREAHTLSVSNFEHVPLALRRRVIMSWLSDIPGIEPNQDRIDAVLRLIARKRGGAAIEVGAGYRVMVSGELLILRRA